MSPMRVLVLGASGTLGRRIVDLLRREAPALTVLGAARRSGPGVDRCFDRADPMTHGAALEGVHALVHAAGPFDHDATPLIEACQARNIHYLDLAEDPAFLHRVRVAAQKRESESRLVPGCSTAPGLVRLLARRFQGEHGLESVDAYLSLGSRNPVSVALLYGLLRPIGARGPEGVTWFSKLSRFHFRDGAKRSFGAYPLAPEVGADPGPPQRLFVGFDRGFINLGLLAAGRLLPGMRAERLRRLCELSLPAIRAARIFGSAQGRLALVARGGDGAEIGRVELRADGDGLDIPVAPILWALQGLAGADAGLPRGILRLDQLVTPDQALGWLRTRGFWVAKS